MNKTVLSSIFLLFASMAVTGCANNVANKAPVAKAPVVQAPQKKQQQQVVVINKPRKTAGSAPTVRPAKKDEHHIRYDQKRMWYNRQWLAKQEAEERQRVQRLKYQQRYEQQQREQAQLQQQQAYQQQQQARIQQQQQRVQQASVRQQQPLNIYQQRQAQIEARQQQYNWQRNGNGWQQAQQANARQKWQQQQQAQARRRQQQQAQARRQQSRRVMHARAGNLAEQLSNAAIGRTYHKVRYDGRYIPISYPMGDVPANMGVCTDTLIRSYRRLGIDLQQLVHEDISRAFHVYPNLPKWGLSAPDPNIDHRRVHNLKVFFARHGRRLPVTNNPADYRPGDIVTWHLGGDQEHIGLVVNRRSPEDPRRHMIVHNIAKGDRMEDILFKLPITGHYRYLPNRSRWLASR